MEKEIANKNIPLSALNKLHEDNPELIGYFCEGAPAVVNSNQCGNVDLGIVNGTKCFQQKLFWKDDAIETEARMLIERAKKRNEKVVEMDIIPDVVIVTPLDKHGNVRSPLDFPFSQKLLECCNNGGIAIPIAMNQTLELKICKKENITIKYYDHALDLGFAFTAWKVQGHTYDCII